MGNQDEGRDPDAQTARDQPLADTEEDRYRPDPRLFTTIEARPKPLHPSPSKA